MTIPRIACDLCADMVPEVGALLIEVPQPPLSGPPRPIKKAVCLPCFAKLYAAVDWTTEVTPP